MIGHEILLRIENQLGITRENDNLAMRQEVILETIQEMQLELEYHKLEDATA